MAENKKEQVRYDLEGSAVLTEAIRALLDQAPVLGDGERFAFASLGAEGGMAMFPGDGAVVEEEHRSVTGRVRQVCRYPFAAVWRGGGLSEQGRAAVKERLDALGRWLGRQPVDVDGKTYRLERYPPLAGGRRFLGFSIQSPACLAERDEHQTETWAAEMAARYENIFYL